MDCIKPVACMLCRPVPQLVRSLNLEITQCQFYGKRKRNNSRGVIFLSTQLSLESSLHYLINRKKYSSRFDDRQGVCRNFLSVGENGFLQISRDDGGEDLSFGDRYFKW